MRWIILGFVALSLTACQGKMEDLKSPCVGAADSPCDRRAPELQGTV